MFRDKLDRILACHPRSNRSSLSRKFSLGKNKCRELKKGTTSRGGLCIYDDISFWKGACQLAPVTAYVEMIGMNDHKGSARVSWVGAHLPLELEEDFLSEIRFS